MKSNAIIRIVLFSVLILILSGLLLSGLGVGRFVFHIGEEYDSYLIGSGEVIAQNIHSIEIDWAAGNVTVQAADTDYISFTEQCQSSAESMVYTISGTQLTIRHSKPILQIGFVPNPTKDLTITIPKDWVGAEFIFNTAATTLNVSGLHVYKLSLNAAAGECEFNECHVDRFCVDAAACELSYNGTVKDVDCDAAAGELSLCLTKNPDSIDIDGATAQLELALPAGSGFRVDMDGLATAFSSEFETIQENDVYLCGDGHCRIQFDGAMGVIKILKFKES